MSAASVPLEQVLELATKAARSAGEVIRSAVLSGAQRSDIKSTKVNQTDLVTETDQRCEEIVMGMIKDVFPDHQIIGEESAGLSKYELTDAPTWIIDPIDGTTNFVHRLALSCVIVAFIHRKEVMVGVVYDPMADELFWATRGGGSFLQRNGEVSKMCVSETEVVPRAVISMDPGYGRDPLSVGLYCSCSQVLLQKGLRNVRVVGCTGLNMAWIACGRLDGDFERGSWERNLGPKIWDFAAGRLLVEEAGGVTRDIGPGLPTDQPLDVMGRSFFCAATPALAQELMIGIAEATAMFMQTQKVADAS